MQELQARVISYSINGCEMLLALAEQQFDWGFDNKHLSHSGLGHAGAEPSQIDLDLGCSRACGEDALIPLAYEYGCLPAKTSYAMSILLLLLSTSFKSAVIWPHFRINPSPAA